MCFPLPSLTLSGEVTSEPTCNLLDTWYDCMSFEGIFIEIFSGSAYSLKILLEKSNYIVSCMHAFRCSFNCDCKHSVIIRNYDDQRHGSVNPCFRVYIRMAFASRKRCRSEGTDKVTPICAPYYWPHPLTAQNHASWALSPPLQDL